MMKIRKKIIPESYLQSLIVLRNMPDVPRNKMQKKYLNRR